MKRIAFALCALVLLLQLYPPASASSFERVDKGVLPTSGLAPLKITVWENIKNTGENADNFTASLVINGNTVETTTKTIEAGATVKFSFTHTLDAGTHTVGISDELGSWSVTVTVTERKLSVLAIFEGENGYQCTNLSVPPLSAAWQLPRIPPNSSVIFWVLDESGNTVADASLSLTPPAFTFGENVDPMFMLMWMQSGGGLSLSVPMQNGIGMFTIPDIGGLWMGSASAEDYGDVVFFFEVGGARVEQQAQVTVASLYLMPNPLKRGRAGAITARDASGNLVPGVYIYVNGVRYGNPASFIVPDDSTLTVEVRDKQGKTLYGPVTYSTASEEEKEETPPPPSGGGSGTRTALMVLASAFFVAVLYKKRVLHSAFYWVRDKMPGRGLQIPR
ncbi:MAG: hypothetical protein JRD89_05230 [Deltaproteobacteria bacterium]|nr:hypothetical protein [Deltaproteobacteria bacterium]